MGKEDNKEKELQAHILKLYQLKKSEVQTHYAQLKIRIPHHLINVTVNSLLEAGATVSPELVVPLATDNYFRGLSNLKRKIIELSDAHIEHLKEYRSSIRKKIPESMLEKKVSDLTDEEWNILGIDMAEFKRILKSSY